MERITGQHSADWHDEWLVVASHGGDPYIFDCSSGRILFARHGQGAWKPIKAFPNLAVMVACLATLGSIIRKTGKNLRDEDFCIRREHYQAAVTAISEIVGSSSVAERVVKNADWETAP